MLPVYVTGTSGQEHNLKHTCPMDGCPKTLPARLQKLHAQTFWFPAICRCVWLVKFLIPKDRRKYMPVRPVQQNSTCPQSKLTCPGHSGSVMFLPCTYSYIFIYMYQKKRYALFNKFTLLITPSAHRVGLWHKIPEFLAESLCFFRGLQLVTWRRQSDSAEVSGIFSTINPLYEHNVCLEVCFQSPKTFTPTFTLVWWVQNVKTTSNVHSIYCFAELWSFTLAKFCWFQEDDRWNVLVENLPSAVCMTGSQLKVLTCGSPDVSCWGTGIV